MITRVGDLIKINSSMWTRGSDLIMYSTLGQWGKEIFVQVPKLAVIIECRAHGGFDWTRVMTIDGEVGWIFDYEAESL